LGRPTRQPKSIGRFEQPAKVETRFAALALHLPGSLTIDGVADREDRFFSGIRQRGLAFQSAATWPRNHAADESVIMIY
jgi:hypothetical protein